MAKIVENSSDEEIKANVLEATQKIMKTTGTPLTVLDIHGRPYRVAEQIVNLLMERNYCMPGDVLLWAIIYRRKQQKPNDLNKKMLIKIEVEGEKDGGQ